MRLFKIAKEADNISDSKFILSFSKSKKSKRNITYFPTSIRFIYNKILTEVSGIKVITRYSIRFSFSKKFINIRRVSFLNNYSFYTDPIYKKSGFLLEKDIASDYGIILHSDLDLKLVEVRNGDKAFKG